MEEMKIKETSLKRLFVTIRHSEKAKLWRQQKDQLLGEKEMYQWSTKYFQGSETILYDTVIVDRQFTNTVVQMLFDNK